MMNPYSSLSDDFYINMHLHTDMDLPNQRETVLHFFEQMQRRYPKLRHFYQRERGEFILEEEKEHGEYRWIAADALDQDGGVQKTGLDRANRTPGLPALATMA